ncbi:UNKNOWN [Stylonychia lemnae]|uniref:Uncharacterized protein n=1 Tax=Stylonychia lemnae TaxID=5949 RepID=A0A078AQ43_STYLE|nr:UNKNOWN [Stylonychia lemnae]|eukprot:CDW84500.1 UNKNOWN [Stylonychia lemnae]
MRYIERDFDKMARQMLASQLGGFKQLGTKEDFGELADMDEDEKNLQEVDQKKHKYLQRQREVQNEKVVDGVRLRTYIYESVKDKDGQQIPYKKIEVQCQPPCDIKTLESNSKLTENADEKEQNILTQFHKDAKEKGIKPKKIQSFKNVIEYDENSKKNKYKISVNFLDEDEERMQYKFSKNEAGETKSKVYALAGDDNQQNQSTRTQGFLNW